MSGRKWEKAQVMFRGRFDTTFDSKGRTSLPARFRELLGASDDGRLVLTTALEPCLVVYPYSGWCEFEKRLAALPSFDPGVKQIKRLYVAGAVECAMDGHGRILVPAVLREYAGLERDAVWTGMVGHMELWDLGRWSEVLKAAKDNADGLAESLAQLGL
ncbi:MAG: division/cell wall cluster transcriptional repressor MraZ [Myxococcota bacterium]|nr:division/cell wall cluster transcriptional repressor MraZ [Myxococcota bacterium]